MSSQDGSAPTDRGTDDRLDQTPAGSATSAARALLDGIAQRAYLKLADLYAIDAVVELPFAQPGGLTLRGRGKIADHFARAANAPLRLIPEHVIIHRTTDPDVVVAEYDYRVTTDRSAESLVVANVQVMRVKDGEIVHSRDFHDHPTIARLAGQNAPAH